MYKTRVVSVAKEIGGGGGGTVLPIIMIVFVTRSPSCDGLFNCVPPVEEDNILPRHPTPGQTEDNLSCLLHRGTTISPAHLTHMLWAIPLLWCQQRLAVPLRRLWVTSKRSTCVIPESHDFIARVR